MFKVRKSVSLFTRIKNSKNALVTGTKDTFQRVEKRVEGTFAEKWLKFWVALGRDYYEVAADVVKESKAKPSKAILIAATGWLVGAFALHNPNATHFRDTFQEAANEAAIVHHSLVKVEVLEHLKNIEHCYNNNLVRYTSFGLFSIVWIDKYSNKCSAYDSQCSYLQLGYSDVFKRIIDVGFLDNWWLLARKMKDYDVNY